MPFNSVHSCAVLRLAPGDIDALKAKLVLLIEVSRLDEALLLLNDASLMEQAPFEKVLANFACCHAFLRPSLHCSHTACWELLYMTLALLFAWANAVHPSTRALPGQCRGRLYQGPS